MKGKPLNDLGQEVLDPTPMEPPVGYEVGPTLMEQIQAMVKGAHLRQAAEAAGYEDFEEADDFDIADDPMDPSTPYEADYEGGRVRDLRAAAEKDALAAARVREGLDPLTGLPLEPRAKPLGRRRAPPIEEDRPEADSDRVPDRADLA